MLWRRPRRPGGRQRPRLALDAAFRPLDPTLIAQCFFPIGRRPVACSAIDLRLALREGRPISRARFFFFRAGRFADFASGGLQRPQTTFPSCWETCAALRERENGFTRPSCHRGYGTRVRDRHERAAARYYASRTSFGDARVRRRHYASASRRCPPSDSVDGHDGVRPTQPPAVTAAAARLGELSGVQRGYWGARAHRSSLLSLAVLSYGWFTCPLFLHLAFSSLPRRVRPTAHLRPRYVSVSKQHVWLPPGAFLRGLYRHFDISTVQRVLTDPHPLSPFAVPYAAPPTSPAYSPRVLPCVSSALHSTSTFSSVARVP